MNAAHVHLMFNHFPLIGFFFSFLVLALGLAKKNESLIRVGFLLFALTGILTVPTYLTGEPAEEIIERSAGFSEKSVEAHEEAAELAVWFIGATALAAAAGLCLSLFKRNVPLVLKYGVAALALVALAVVARTNNLGGKISHPELRDSNQIPPAEGGD